MATSAFQLGTGTNAGNGENTDEISSGGLATDSDHNLFIINQTNSALVFPAPESSSDDLTEAGEWPRTLQPGESYRFIATATGPAHSISWAAGTITSTHTFNSVSSDNANGLQRPNNVYFSAIT